MLVMGMVDSGWLWLILVIQAWCFSGVTLFIDTNMARIERWQHSRSIKMKPNIIGWWKWLYWDIKHFWCSLLLVIPSTQASSTVRHDWPALGMVQINHNHLTISIAASLEPLCIRLETNWVSWWTRLSNPHVAELQIAPSSMAANGASITVTTLIWNIWTHGRGVVSQVHRHCWATALNTNR